MAIEYSGRIVVGVPTTTTALTHVPYREVGPLGHTNTRF